MIRQLNRDITRKADIAILNRVLYGTIVRIKDVVIEARLTLAVMDALNELENEVHSRYTVVKKDGTPCHAPAVLRDPDARYVFHSSLNFSAAKKANEVTRAEVVRTVGREIWLLRKAKDLNPILRADALRNLILLWQSLTAPEPEPVVKSMSFEEKLKKLEDKRKEN